MSSDVCDVRKARRKAYEKACASAGLDKKNLSFFFVLNSMLGVIFGLAAQRFFEMLSADVPSNKMRQATILIISLNLVVFLALKTFIRSRLCYALWQHSENWFDVITGMASNFKFFSMFLVTSFLTTEFLHEWISSRYSTIETVSGIWNVFLVLNFIRVVASK
jgi:hypothetical protein